VAAMDGVESMGRFGGKGDGCNQSFVSSARGVVLKESPPPDSSLGWDCLPAKGDLIYRECMDPSHCHLDPVLLLLLPVQYSTVFRKSKLVHGPEEHGREEGSVPCVNLESEFALNNLEIDDDRV
jgi:hypothetical protein